MNTGQCIREEKQQDVGQKNHIFTSAIISALAGNSTQAHIHRWCDSGCHHSEKKKERERGRERERENTLTREALNGDGFCRVLTQKGGQRSGREDQVRKFHRETFLVRRTLVSPSYSVFLIVIIPYRRREGGRNRP